MTVYSSMPPSVLFVDHSSQLGGAEFVLLDIVQDYVGNASVWLFEDGPLRGRLQQIGLKTILEPGLGDLTAIKRDRNMIAATLPALGGMARIVRKLAAAARQHDLVYANSQKAFVLASIAAAIARRPLIWHLHDIMTAEHFGTAQRALIRLLANRLATRVIVPSTAAAAAFEQAGGRADLVRMVPNGVTLASAGAGRDAERMLLRAEFALPTGFIAGVFSRLAFWKGQHVVLEALVHCAGVSCIIAGSPLFGEEIYARTLRARAAELGVADRVRFLGQRDDVPALMRAVDVVVHPSTAAEPFGRTLVEAMASHILVIAAEAGAVPEILDHGRAGLQVAPGDAEALAAAMQRVMADPAAFDAMRETAAARAEALFSSATMRARVAAVIEEATLS